MGRAQRRATAREEERTERKLASTAKAARTTSARPVEGESRETSNQTARRIYRTGGNPKPPQKKRRRQAVKPTRWQGGSV